MSRAFHNRSQPTYAPTWSDLVGEKVRSGTNFDFAHLYTTDYNVLMGIVMGYIK